MTTYAGADGCRRGWAVALLEGDRFLPLHVFGSLADVAEATGQAAFVLVDIPMGLTDGQDRLADREARRLLGRQGSSIFPVPVRAAVHASDYREACALNQAATGRKLSVQTWGIVPKMAEADRLLRHNPRLQQRLKESHPELSFLALNGWVPLRASKKTPEGQAERLDLLSRLATGASEALAAARSAHLRATVATDDLLDAMVLAVAAREAFALGVPSVPVEPQVDAFGLKMEIVCPAALPQRS